MKQTRIITALLFLLPFANGGCAYPGLRLPRIDPSGEQIFLPAPDSTTIDPSFGLPFRAPRRSIWESPPQAPYCGTPDSGGLVVPYSIYGPDVSPPAVVAVPGGPGSIPVVGPAVAQAVPPSAALTSPPHPTQLTGETSGNRSDGIPGRLTLNPYRLVAPIGQEVLIRAAICGDDGYFITGESLEWSLSPESVGTIVEVDQNNKSLWRQLLNRPPFKRDGTYARGLTSAAAQVIPRGNPGPDDDIRLESGQTWISVSSAAEGATRVTCVAPRLSGWEQRRSTATVYWIDGQWNFPSPAIGNPTSGHVLCTRVARASSGAPLPGWRVAYEIVGGTPALFSNGSAQIEVASDPSGNACARVSPQGMPSGVTHVRMRVIRTGQAPGDSESFPVGEGTTTITWNSEALPSTFPTPQAPLTPPTTQPEAPLITPPADSELAPPARDPVIPLSTPPPSTPPPSTPPPSTPPPSTPPLSTPPLSTPPLSTPPLSTPPPSTPPMTAPARLEFEATGPLTARSDSAIDYVFTVRNTGSTRADHVEIVSRSLPGYQNSSPPANVIGDRLLWSIGSIEPGQSHEFIMRYQPDRGGILRKCATLTWAGAQPVERCVTTEVALNALVVDLRGVPSARIGDEVRYEITVTNLSNRALNNVTLKDTYDAGFSHEGAKVPGAPLEWNIGTLAAGQSVTRHLPFRVMAAGQLCHEVSVTADDGSSAKKGICLNAGQDLGSGPVSGGRPSVQIRKLETLGRTEVIVGQTLELQILVTNTGQVPLTHLKIFDEYDALLEPESSVPLAQRLENDNRRIYWDRDFLAPGETMRIGIRCTAKQASPRVCDTVTVTTAEGVSDTNQLCLQIRERSSRPTFDDLGANLAPRWTKRTALSGSDRAEPSPEKQPLQIDISPAAQGLNQNKQTYYLTVTNTTELDEQDVTLTIETPEGSTFVSSLNPPMVRAARRNADLRTVEFTPIATLRANETARFRVVIERSQSKIGNFRAKASSRREPAGTVFVGNQGENKH